MLRWKEKERLILHRTAFQGSYQSLKLQLLCRECVLVVYRVPTPALSHFQIRISSTNIFVIQ
jgi:hypothetical protein